jgi:hypothetical protein
MRRLGIVGIGFLGCCLFSVCVFAEPKLVVSETVFDFGSREAMGNAEHDFIIQNMGTEVLKIERVSSSCGCTTAKLEQTEIPPGASTAIHASFDLKGRSGEQEKTITIYSNDPKQPQLILTLKGKLIRELDISPQGLFWGRIGDSPLPVKSLTIASATPFEITGIRVTDSHLEAEAISEIVRDESGRMVRTINTRLVPPFAAGRLGGDIEIETTLPNASLVTILFAAYYMP